jgi:hypothetical protein
LTGAESVTGEPPKDLSGFRYEVDTDGVFRPLSAQERIDKIARSQVASVSEIRAQIEGEDRRHVEAQAERVFQERYSELMELHGIVDDFVPATPAYVVDAVREAEEEFARDYPDAVPVSAHRANPAVIEPMIAQGVDMRWLEVDGDGNQARRGAVNPTPWSAVGDESAPQQILRGYRSR